jgi:hypothetical protein
LRTDTDCLAKALGHGAEPTPDHVVGVQSVVVDVDRLGIERLAADLVCHFGVAGGTGRPQR